MRSLNGKVAIVSGTSRGVDVGIAHELLLAGATVGGIPVRVARPSRRRQSAGRGGPVRIARCAIRPTMRRSMLSCRGLSGRLDIHEKQRRRNRADAARRGGSGVRSVNQGTRTADTSYRCDQDGGQSLRSAR
jgi:NAD(P)-dependent dehydrogenase (short-subunit alcohol dehydrogenase family)